MKRIMDIIHQLTKNNYIFFGMIAAAMIVVILFKDSTLETTTVSHPDSRVELSAEDDFLEQTWTPHVKRITGVSVPFHALSTFGGILKLEIYSDDYEKLMAEEVCEYSFEEGQQSELVFSFKRADFDIGSRYRFRLAFTEGSEKGVIEIPAGSEYMGASLNGEEIGEAVALNITFLKNSRIFWLAATFFPFFLLALYFALRWDRRIEETLGLAFLAVPLILFVFGLVGWLEAGIIAIFVLTGVSLVCSFLLSQRKNKNVWEFFTPGLVVYGGVIVFFLITYQNIFMRGWDEYIHWGLAAKDMFYFDSFSKHVNSTVALIRYPPFSTLIEYFFTYTNEMFSEGILYIAYFALAYSLLLVIFKDNSWKNRKFLLSSAVITCTLPLIFFSFFASIYVDLLLAVLLAYGLVCYFSEKLTGFNALRICAALWAMVLTKDMGLVLAGLFVIMVAVDILYEKIRIKEKITKKNIVIWAAFALSVILPFVIWQVYVNLPLKEEAAKAGNNVTKMVTGGAIASSQISLPGIWELITGQAEEYKYEVINNYLNAILQGPTFRVQNFSFSYAALGILTIVISLVIGFKSKREGAAYKYGEDKILRFSILSWIILCGYGAFLLITYLFAFSSKEALSLASHERYFGSCIGGVTMAFWIMTVMAEHRNKSTIRERAVYMISGILLFTAPLIHFIPGGYETNIKDYNIEEYDAIEETLKSFANKGESIYYIYNNSYNYDLERIVFKNYACPAKAGAGAWYASEEYWEKEKEILEENHETLVVKTIVPLEKAREIIKEYDYVFLHRPGYVFAQSYGELFEQPETIGYKTYYKVVKNQGNVVLQYMGQVK